MCGLHLVSEASLQAHSINRHVQPKQFRTWAYTREWMNLSWGARGGGAAQQGGEGMWLCQSGRLWLPSSLW